VSADARIGVALNDMRDALTRTAGIVDEFKRELRRSAPGLAAAFAELRRTADALGDELTEAHGDPEEWRS